MEIVAFRACRADGTRGFNSMPTPALKRGASGFRPLAQTAGWHKKTAVVDQAKNPTSANGRQMWATGYVGQRAFSCKDRNRCLRYCWLMFRLLCITAHPD